MMLASVRSPGWPSTVRFLNDPRLYSASVRKSKTATIIEFPSSAVIWQPVCCESLSETELPNAVSTAFLSSARQTALVPPPPPDDEDSLGDADGEPLGDPEGDSVVVGPPPPLGRTASSASVPRPDTVLVHPATNTAASSTARAATARRATMGASSSVMPAVLPG